MIVNSSPSPTAIMFLGSILVAVFVAGVIAGRGVQPRSEWTQPPHDRKVVCYVATWANYRVEPASFLVNNIDPSLCTHLIYAFAGLDNITYTIQSLDPWTDLDAPEGRGFFRQMTDLKVAHPHVKVLLAIGGYNEGSENYSQLASDPNRRRGFINSVVEFVRDYNFDGFDLDWEYPGGRGGVPEDRQNFVYLVQEFRAEFDNHGWLLSAAFGAGFQTMDIAYDMPALGQSLDLMNVMAYDYHGSWDNVTGANAPFYRQSDRWSVMDTLDHLIEMGAPLDKVNLGLPFYGHTFILLDPEAEGANQFGAPSQFTGFPGELTKSDGFMGFHEICAIRYQPQWVNYYDEPTGTPYLVNYEKVVSYDDEESLRLKVQYAVRMGVGGLMIWSVDTDDFHGNCGEGQYPLLVSINNAVVSALAQDTNKAPTPPREKNVICYVSTWANYRIAPANFRIENIDPSLCTHLIYAFAGLDNVTYTIQSLDPWTDLEPPEGRGFLKQMTDLKQDNPHLTVLLGVGGYGEGSEKYSTMAADPELRDGFTTSAVEFLKEYNFDGLDLDWEYPTLRGGAPEDKANFVQLVKELRTEFDKSGFLLTASFGAGYDTIDAAYDIPSLSEHLDLLNIMAYDYHGAWDKKTGSNAPLYRQTDRWSVMDTLDQLVELGAPLEKVMLGMPMYGHTFVLIEPAVEDGHQLGAASETVGFPGDYTASDGFLGFHEICMIRDKPEWTRYWDEQTGTPFLVNKDKLVSYDDEESFRLKVEYAIRRGVGGLMLWSLDTDDFQGDCDGNKFPLLVALNDAVSDTLAESSTSGGVVTEESATSQAPDVTVDPATPPATKTTTIKPTTTTDNSGSWTRPPHDKKVICYVGTWAYTGRTPEATFTTDKIDPRLCTHLVYSFAGLNPLEGFGDADPADHALYTIMSLDKHLDYPPDEETGALDNYMAMTKLRAKYPHVKVMLAVGGFGEGSEKYSVMVSSAAKRRIFILSALAFVQKYEFDGLDLDWEFPATRGGVPEDKENFVLLVKELHKEFKVHDLLLSAAVHAGVDTMEIAYDFYGLGKYLDMINIMAYDYHGSWDKVTGVNSPLDRQADKWSIQDTLDYLSTNGAPLEKVMLGLPMYGHTFIMNEPPFPETLGAACKADGFKGPFIGQAGFLGYNEVAYERNINDSWIYYWDDKTSTPYIINNENVVSYDDEESIGLKVDYAIRYGVGGLMIWSIETDDFGGKWSPKKYPLLKKANNAVRDALANMPTTDPEAATTTPPPVTTTDVPVTTPDSTDEWTSPPHSKKVVCYVSTWANYRAKPADFYIPDIDPRLCTHLVYAFAGLSTPGNDEIISLDKYADIDRDFFRKMTSLRVEYPHLTILLAIGGYDEGSEKYSNLAASPTKRKNFVTSVLKMLLLYEFDGLDLDWEFPAARGGSPGDKINFVELCKDLRSEFDRYGFLLTAAIHAAPSQMALSYDLPALGPLLDMINVMAYDYHGPFDEFTGANAPLYRQADNFSVTDTLEYLGESGVPMEKIMLGLAFYGHSFLLNDPSAEGSTELGAPSDDTGYSDAYTKTKGFLGYSEICLDMNAGAYDEYWDAATGTPYLIHKVNKEKVVSYDNERSLALKVDYAVRFGVGGLMAWSIEIDDFRGDCGGVAYPLLKTISKTVVATLRDMEEGATEPVVATTVENTDTTTRFDLTTETTVDATAGSTLVTTTNPTANPTANPTTEAVTTEATVTTTAGKGSASTIRTSFAVCVLIASLVIFS